MRFSTTIPMYSVRSLPMETSHPSLRHLSTLARFADALSKGELFRLDMSLLKAAKSTPLEWVDVEKAPYATSYQPVMALAQNHVFFLNVPGTAAGSADIYVIHCESSSYSLRWTSQNLFTLSQMIIFSLLLNPSRRLVGRSPRPMARPRRSSKRIRYMKLLALLKPFVSLLHQVQEAFAFVPDDCSATYVLNVQTNTSQILAAPSTKDPLATYYASITALVQLDSKGDVSYLPFSLNDTKANEAAQWSKVISLANAAPPTTGSSASTSASGSAPKSSGSSKSNSSSSTSSNSTATVAPRGVLGVLVSAAILVCSAVLF
jgi:hypothetical protein